MTDKLKSLLKQIGEKAEWHDWNVSFNGKSKGNKHLQRVQKIAAFLHKKEGGDEFITRAGAWVHDVSLSVGNDTDPNTIKEETLKFLNQFEINIQTKEQIANAVFCHEGEIEAQSIEAKIIHDADVIDKSGLLGVIRHTWKMTNLIKDRILTTDDDFIELKKHILNREAHVYTNTGEKLIKTLNKELVSFFENERAKSVIKEISVLASKGVISDNIAEKLIISEPFFTKKLSAQLSCSYLSD